MATVYLTSAGQPSPRPANFEIERVRTCFEADRFEVHQLTDDPDAADMIIFAELGDCAGPLLERIRGHEIIRRYRNKTFVFAPRYKGVPMLPGVYASIPSYMHHPQRTRSSHYTDVALNEQIRKLPPWRMTKKQVGSRHYLYSFVGSVWTAPVRERLAEMPHDQGYFEDTTEKSRLLKESGPDAEWNEYRRHFVETCQRSAFVVCPRGIGPATLRLFEAMKMGRAPVILADDWKRPEGPNWSTFSVTVPESDIARLNEILAPIEPHASEMGRRARQAFEEWFSVEVTFHRIVEWCQSIQDARRMSERLLAIPSYLRTLYPSHLKKRFTHLRDRQ
jgi:glycosyltransferase involved in cell wall biosynthesis